MPARSDTSLPYFEKHRLQSEKYFNSIWFLLFTEEINNEDVIKLDLEAVLSSTLSQSPAF